MRIAKTPGAMLSCPNSTIGTFSEAPVMNRGNLSRRGFLQSSTLALTAAGLPLWYAREVIATEEDKPAKPESDIIKVGIVGIGSQGKGSKGSQMESRARQLV